MTDSANVPTNKTELLAFMRAHWAGFVSASDALTDDIWLGPVDVNGWSIRDHVGHVGIWLRAETALLGAGTPIPESTGIPEAIWNDGDTDAINEWFRQTLAHASPAEIRAERDRVFPELFETVAAISDEELARPARERGLEASDRPLLEVMSENYGLHFDDHRAQIEQLGKTGA
jgi:hypothetical protein